MTAWSRDGPFAVRRVFAHGNEDAAVAVVNGEATIEPREKTPGRWTPGRVFGVAVEAPQLAAGSGVVGAQPTVATAEEHLGAAVHRRGRGTAPLAVEHVLAGPDGSPDDLPEPLSTAIRLGARGEGTRVWPSFRPLDVHSTSRSPSGSTSLLQASWGKTPNAAHRSSSQMMSAARRPGTARPDMRRS
jgi:hypothetical protein